MTYFLQSYSQFYQMIMKLIILDSQNDHHAYLILALYIEQCEQGKVTVVVANVYNCIYCVGRVYYSSNAGPRPNTK